MGYEIQTASLPASDAVAIRAVVPMAELQKFFGPAFHDMNEVVTAGGATTVGPPFARYYSVSPEAVDVEAVMPINKAITVPAGRVRAIHLNASRAAIVRHQGPYDTIAPVYDAIAEWMRANGKEASEAPREVYLTSPAEVANPADWVTLVEQPIA